MKFIVKNISRGNIINLMRGIGYHFQGVSKEKDELTFVHSISSNPYPRFHIYLKENKETGEIFINLHIDQKKPIYKGAPAHSAEYEGEVIEKEAERIKDLLSIKQ